MILKGIIDNDIVNYKKISMVLEFPVCKNFKCDKECGKKVCQNSSLASAPNICIPSISIIDDYINNPLTQAIVMQGLEPFDSWDDLYHFIVDFRKHSDDDVVIYTGYTEEEIYHRKDIIDKLKQFKNIIIKFGRFIPNQSSHYDEVIGVNLASPNQYGKRLT